MLKSIFEDLQRTLQSGTMVARLMIINAAVFILLSLLKVFDFNAGRSESVYNILKDALSLPSDPGTILGQPWSIFTHMFLHVSFWHIFWNMLLLLWFGRIVGDFLGDKRILPIYILSGLFGALIYILSDLFLPGGSAGNAYALGASAAVMAMIWTAATLSPDYLMHLILIGPVKLKYIALVLLFLDIIGTAGMSNTGGHYAHLGGAAFGMLYVVLLRRGTDVTAVFQRDYWIEKARERDRNSKFKVVHKKQETREPEKKENRKLDEQQELDRILDKINKQGYDQLTEDEKEFLYQASKNK